MPTIFVEVLQHFARTPLDLLVQTQKDKAKNGRDNSELSATQALLVDQLYKDIMYLPTFESDAAAFEHIKKHFEATISEIKEARKAHKKAQEKGLAITTLQEIIAHVDSFYDSLKVYPSEEYTFKLLDKPYEKNVLSIGAYYFAYYLAEELFHSKVYNHSLREKKEAAFARRLQTLYDSVKPEQDIAVQRKKAHEMIEDLKTDNDRLCAENTVSIKPTLSFFGVGLSSSYLTSALEFSWSGPGRLQGVLASLKLSIDRADALSPVISNQHTDSDLKKNGAQNEVLEKEQPKKGMKR